MKNEVMRAEAEAEVEGELGPYRRRRHDLYRTFGRSRDGWFFGDKKGRGSGHEQ